MILNANRGILTAEGAEGPPDFVVEILSPKTRKLDLVNKTRVYSRLGVKELWIIDPEPGTIKIQRFEERADDPGKMFYPGDVLESSLLPGFSIEVLSIFVRG